MNETPWLPLLDIIFWVMLFRDSLWLFFSTQGHSPPHFVGRLASLHRTSLVYNPQTLSLAIHAFACRIRVEDYQSDCFTSWEAILLSPSQKPGILYRLIPFAGLVLIKVACHYVFWFPVHMRSVGALALSCLSHQTSSVIWLLYRLSSEISQYL